MVSLLDKNISLRPNFKRTTYVPTDEGTISGYKYVAESGARELTMDLSLILNRCKEGDAIAWEALVRQYQSRVYGIAYHFVGNAEDARDLAQEVFVRVYQRLNACTGAEMFFPWLIRIARNASIDHLRRRKARRQDRDVPLDAIADLPGRGNNPEQQWADDSRKRLIYRALEQLTDLNREIILLKEIEGMQLDEIASMLQVPLGTIKSRSNRARLELAQKVLALGGEPS
jgi:RNA polymerase sigma-70 factor (ECF subfamily)